MGVYGKVWENMGEKTADRRSAPASYTLGNAPAYTHYRPGWRHEKPPLLTVIYRYIPFCRHQPYCPLATA